MKKHLSEVINVEQLRVDQFNLILSGVGTGKTYFSLTKDGMIKKINEAKKLNIHPSEVLFITSRKLTVEQQSYDLCNIGVEFNQEQLIALFENSIGGEPNIKQIPVMTYNAFYHLLNRSGYLEGIDRMINHFKVIIFDEAHAIIKDESFIKEMGRIKEFIVGRLENKENTIYLIGMTATGELLKEYLKVPINEILDKPLHNYYVENLYAIKPLDVYPTLVKMQGNSIVMVDTVKNALKLKEKLGNTAKVLISKYRDEYTEEMDETRQYIVEHNALEPDCKVLITTSCMREGINLLADKCIIDNVFCYDVTTTTVVQFTGRYRGNVKNLVLVNAGTNMGVRLPFEQNEYNNFICLLQGKDEGVDYLLNLAPILRRGLKTKVISQTLSKEELLKDYINEKWLYKVIVTKEQKQELVDFATVIGIRNEFGNKITFIKLLEIIKEQGFFVATSGKSKKVTKKIREKIDYINWDNINKITPYVIWSK